MSFPTTPDEQREVSAYYVNALGVAGIERARDQPQRAFVERDGLRLHYLDWGGAGEEEIVLVHGGALNAHTWDLVCLGLDARARVVAVDLRGHGDSDWSRAGEYGLADFSRDVEAVVAHLGLRAITLVGHSLGGLTSLYLAEHGETALRRLVLVDVGPATQAAGRERIARFMRASHEPRPFEAYIDAALRFNPRRRRDLLTVSLRHSLRRTDDGLWHWKYDPVQFSDRIRDARQEERRALEAGLSEIRCPVLVMRASESDVLSHADAAALVAALPHGRLVEVERAGHTIQGDDPSAVVAAIETFIGSTPA